MIPSTQHPHRARRSARRALIAGAAGLLLPVCLMVAGSGIASADAVSPAPQPTPRVAAMEPFAVQSPWNVSIGSKATYSSKTSTITKSLLKTASWAYINAAVYSIPVVVSSASDPLRTVTINGVQSAAFHVPDGVVPAAGTDGNLTIIDGVTSHEFWQVDVLPSGDLSASYGRDVDLRGQGTSGGVRASGFSTVGGLIRSGDLTGIDHALVVALAADQLKSGPVWPAMIEDGDALSSYSGLVPMGSLIAIPRSVDVTSLGLSPSGLVLAHALQDYGAYVGDRSSALTLYAEPSADGPQLNAMRDDLRNTLAAFLRVVTNSSSTAVGGPGVRAQPAAAALAAP